ncbi:MAG: cation transporter [Prevotella sp.]|nr:cation transporter [Prevotella sp.]
MKTLMLFLAALLMPAYLSAQDNTDSFTIRIKTMSGEECAHKVKNRLLKEDGVERLSFDLEKRTATISYDHTKICADSITSILNGTRYKASPYNENDTILCGMELQMSDMHCQNCANRIMKRFEGMEGIDSMAAHVDKHSVFFRYDANRTCKADIREVLGEMGFTPVNYYTSKDISYAYFLIPEDTDIDEAIDMGLSLGAVDDANANKRRHSLAITYANKYTTEEKLLEGLRSAGINATLPAPHECKE